MVRNVKMKNGDYSGDLGTENYCKDAKLVSIVIAIKVFGNLDTLDYGLSKFDLSGPQLTPVLLNLKAAGQGKQFYIDQAEYN